MIPVIPRPEPAGVFDDLVRQPGLRWLVQKLAEATILRLGLRDPETKAMRARHFEEYLRGHVDGDHLRRWSPFVWYEAQRQGLL